MVAIIGPNAALSCVLVAKGKSEILTGYWLCEFYLFPLKDPILVSLDRP